MNESLHAVGALFLHLVCHVPVDVQREGRRGVSQVTLNRLHIVSGL